MPLTSLQLEFECPEVTKWLRQCTPHERREIMRELIVIAETRLGMLCGSGRATQEQWDIARAEVMAFLALLRPPEPAKEPDLFDQMREATDT